ncbi:PTS sugar transporter subunit IIA [Heyndrickxia acidiproducens]|uniref:PTS sugar transporter subunit IIA n=1 Tax=Heyndrickxia acidiproducens TaxID=1121084 RepID=UPI00036788A1|nr:PTS glucose transporter subunit IIA [Heyndrickxia acidiproducens]
MFKLFNRKPTEEHIFAPLTGEAVAIEEVPDPTFSEKMMGDGAAIKPADGTVVSPFDGEVIQVFPTKHAIGLRGKSGVEILIHVGLETVALNGDGFESLVKAGQKVKKGEPLLTFNLEFIKENAANTITSIVVTNSGQGATIDKHTGAESVAGETEIITVHLKS